MHCTGVKAPLCMSQRLLLSIMCFWGTFFIYAARVNLSMAILCMVRSDDTSNVTFVGLNISNSTSSPGNGAGDGACDDLTGGDKSASSNQGEFDWDKATTSRLLSMYFYGYIFTQILGGWLASRYGGKKIWGLCMFTSGICCFITPIAARTSIHFAYAVRFILGFTAGVSFPCIHALLGRWAPLYERSQLGAIPFSGPHAGLIATYSISGLLCEYGFDNGWGSIFYLCGITNTIWVICWFYLTASTPEEHKRITPFEREYIRTAIGKGLTDQKQKVPWRQIFTSRPVWAIIIAHFCTNYITYTLMTSLPMFMKEALKFDIKKNGLMSSLPNIGNVLGNLLAGYAADSINERGWLQVKNTRKLFQTISFLGTGAGFCILVQIDCTRRYTAVALLCLCKLIVSTNRGAYIVNHIDLAPSYAGVLYGITNTVATIPGIIAPELAGALTPNKTHEEWKSVFYVVAGVCLVGAIFYCLLADGELQPWSETNDVLETHVHIKTKDVFERDVQVETKDAFETDVEVENKDDEIGDMNALDESAIPLVTLPGPQENGHPTA